MTRQELLNAGFREFHDGMEAAIHGKDYIRSYQKRYSDETGILYHLTISHSYIVKPTEEYFKPTAQFTRDGMTINIEMVDTPETVEQVEAFFSELWTSMKFDYYEGGEMRERRVPQAKENDALSLQAKMA